ncbi:MAG: sulfotransferase [bacterium]|nr:sulfotransferase [bacterium]
MSLKVIGSGVGRTGTHSLKLALEQLGFSKCYHMIELFENPEGIKYFKRAERGLDVNWDELFKGYSSAVDYPVARYYKQLMKYYPDAKIIQTVRDPESWFKSISQTIFKVSQPTLVKKLKLIMKLPFSSAIRKKLPIYIFNGKLVESEFGKDLTNKEEIIKRFIKRNEEVIKIIPKENLLLLAAKDGWEPLCKFLNVPVPSTPYPVTNSTEEFLKLADEAV